MAKNQGKRELRIFEGFVIIIFMQGLGTFLARQFDLILPGNLVGLLLLFFALLLKIIKLEMVEGAAKLLLNNMMVLFIPLNVGLVTIFSKLKEEGLAILVSLLASTVIVMIVTAKAVEMTERRRRHVKHPS